MFFRSEKEIPFDPNQSRPLVSVEIVLRDMAAQSENSESKVFSKKRLQE